MIIRKLICPDSRFGCMEGSGAGSGGGSDKQSKGTTFGVDGVSKTGSTAKDAAIGYTSGEGTGKAGPNFGALKGATTEQTKAAVATAQQAQRQGSSPTEAQRAVSNMLGSYSPGAVSKSGQITAQGSDLISNAIEQAKTESKEAFRAGEVAGIGRQPLREISPSTPGMTGPGSFMSGAQEISGIRPNITAATMRPDELTTEAFSSSPLASLLTQMQQTPAVDVSNMTNMALARNIQNPVYEAELNRRALAGDQDAMNLFDNALVRGYITDTFNYGLTDTVPEDVAGTYAMDDLAGDLALNPNLFAGAPVTMEDAISANRVLAPAQVGPPAAQMQTIGPATQAVQGEYYGEDLQQPDIFGTPGGQFTELYGFPNATALGEFQTQAMRPSKALGSVMNFSLLGQGISALTGKNPMEMALSGGRQSMQDILAAGGKFNPDTGRIEAELPSGRLQMNNMGMVTYSGMPDPNYSGPFANLVNPAPERQGGEMQPIVEEEVVNPCPPGYALVDGVCQPSDQMGGATTGLPNSQPVLPNLPPVFQPTYQPFQPQPLNPFVLSPTGAALGRSV